MQKLSHFIRKHSKSGSLSSPSTSTPSFEEDIYLYRKQRGVNLGKRSRRSEFIQCSLP